MITIDNYTEFEGFTYQNKCFTQYKMLYPPNKDILKTYWADVKILSNVWDFETDLGHKYFFEAMLNPEYINLSRKEKIKFYRKNRDAELWQKLENENYFLIFTPEPENRQCIGYIFYEYLQQKKRSVIKFIFIIPSYQRLGYASRAVYEFISIMQKKHVKYIHIDYPTYYDIRFWESATNMISVNIDDDIEDIEDYIPLYGSKIVKNNLIFTVNKFFKYNDGILL